MKKLYNLLSALLLSLALINTAHAVSLQSLFDGGSLTVGDKLFDQWSLIDMTSTDLLQDPDYTLIDVMGLASDPLNPGLRFTAGDELTVMNESFIDLSFGFRVSTLSGQALIKDNELGITSYEISRADAQGDPLIAIIETVNDALGTELAETSVEKSFLASSLVDSAQFAPQASLLVTKNILVAGLAQGDKASLKGFDQHFSQVTIPEPATWLMLSLGLLGFTRFRWALSG